jgi:hypothetical protein
VQSGDELPPAADDTVTVEPRTYFRRSGRNHEVIVVALSDSFHPVTSGAYGLNEDYRYTVEAVGDYLDRLSPDGLLVLTRWLQTPPSESLRVLATVVAALERKGVSNPEDHIAAYRSLRTMTFVVCDSPLRSTDRDTIRRLSDDLGYDLVWLPGMSRSEANLRNRLPEPVYHMAATELLADPRDYVSRHDFDIRPPTDDRPFFNHYFRWQQTPQVLASLGRTWQPFGGSGYLVLLGLLAVLTVLSAVLVMGPLLIGRVPAGSPEAPRATRLLALLYFGALGFGYLCVLLPIAQKMILLVGDAATALALVFFSVLLWSGFGSLSAPRWRLELALPALVLLTALAPIVLPAVVELALPWGGPARILAVVAVLAPVGYMMGIPFARGLRTFEQFAPRITAWAWAVNGTASVVCGVIATMLAVGYGFSAVLAVGALSYLLALIAIWPLARRPAAA